MYRIEISGNTLEELKDNLHTLASDMLVVQTVTLPDVSVDPLIKHVAEPLGEMKTEFPSKVSTVVNNIITKSNELDIEGLPWDERIHASTKTKVGGGSWKRRRNVSEEEFNKVAAELRNKIANMKVEIPAPPVVPAPAEVQQVELTPQLDAPPVNFGAPPVIPEAMAEVPHMPQPHNVTIIAPPEVAQPLPVAPIAQPPSNVRVVPWSVFLPTFANVIQDLINLNKITMEWVSEKTKKYEVQYVYQITSDLTKAKGLYTDMVTEGLIAEG